MSTYPLRHRRGYLRAALIASAVLTVAIGVAATLDTEPAVAVAIPAAVISILICLRRPVWGVAAALASSACYGSLEAFTGISVGPAVDVALAGLWGSVVISAFAERMNLVLWPSVVALAVYLALTFVEITTATSLELGLRSFRFMGWYMAVVVLLAISGWHQSAYEQITRVLIVVACLVGAYATFRWIVGPTAAEQEHAFASAGNFNFVDGELKVVGSFPSRQELGFWTATMIPYLFTFALVLRGRWRILAGAGWLLCIIALLGSHVRIGLLGTIVGTALVVALLPAARSFPRRRAKRIAAAFATLLIGGAVFVFTADDSGSDSPYSALLNPSGDPAYEARVKKWKAAVVDIGENPLGLGLGTAGRLQEFGRGDVVNVASYGIDSSYLKVAYEQGFLVMFFLAASLLALLVALARTGIAVKDPQTAGTAIAGSASLATAMTMFVGGQYIEGLIILPVWIAVGTAIGQLNAARRGALRNPE